MNNFLIAYRTSLAKSLENLSVSLKGGEPVDHDFGLNHLCELTQVILAARRTIHFVGNGASACMASHLAVDWVKNAGVRALAYNDIAFLTAIGNDLGYDQVFAQPVGWFGEEGDLLATISSSGNSPSILRAIEAARGRKMKVVTFSGMKPDNASRKMGDLNFYVPGWTYGIIECAHQVLLHAWLDCSMGVKEWELTGPQVIIPTKQPQQPK
jgi:D-sedoheptulose 7-phosphate isomerase